MKNKKFLKKLTAAALGLGLGASSMASVGAISPKSLWKNHIQNQSKSDILQKYYQQIQPELYKNLSVRSETDVAKFFLDGKIPELSNLNDGYLNPHDTAVNDAHNILNGKHLDQNDNKASIFKEYIFQKLLESQAKIGIIKTDVQNKKNALKNNRTVSLDYLNKYSNNPIVKQKINMINTNKQNCLNFANLILNADASLKSVNEWKKSFDSNYAELQNKMEEALRYVNFLGKMPNNNFNPFGFANIPNSNFNPFGFANIPNNNFNPFGFANIPNSSFNPFGFANIPNSNFNPFGFPNIPNNNFNPSRFPNIPNSSFNPSRFPNIPSNNFNPSNFPNIPNSSFNPFKSNNMSNSHSGTSQFNNINNVAPPPVMIQNQINPINDAQEKKALENRFKKLSSGNQQIAGPCWLYATTTAINEFRDRTNSGPIIKRQPGDYREYGPVEIAYTNAGFENPLSINAGGINGKKTQDILNYARSQGLEARNVMLFKHDHLGMNKNELVKVTADLLREHFKHHKSPVLVEAPWGSGEFHELTIAGISGNELLVVNSIGDTITWQPIEKLSDYCKYGTLFSLVFFGNKENPNSEHESLNLASMQNIDSYNKAKNNLLKFARDDFNRESLR